MSLFCNTTSFATGYSTDEPKGKIEISEDDSLSENVVDTLTNENVITQLDKIGISVDECQSYEILEEEDNGVKLQKDDLNYICLDQEGEIYRISTYSYEDAGYIANELQTYECTDAIVDECISKISDLYGYDLKDEYEEINAQRFDQYLIQVVLEKKYSEELVNPYESIRIFYNTASGDVDYLRKFDDEPNATSATISENEATIIFKQYFEEMTTDISSVILTCYKKAEGDSDDNFEIRLAYKISDEGGIVSHIDAVTGEILAVDSYLKTGKAFAMQDPNANATINTYFTQNAAAAKAGMQSLGYSCLASYVSSSSNMKTKVLDYFLKSEL